MLSLQKPTLKEKKKKMPEQSQTEPIKVIQTWRNSIELDGISIHSIDSGLEELEEVLNRIIKKHRAFLLERKEQTKLINYC